MFKMIRQLRDWAFPLDPLVGRRAPSWDLNRLIEQWVFIIAVLNIVFLAKLSIPWWGSILLGLVVSLFWPEPGLGERFSKWLALRRLKAEIEAMGPPVDPADVVNSWKRDGNDAA